MTTENAESQQAVECPNCGKPVARRDEHFIDAERLGIDWLCQSIHPRKDGTCGRDYSSSGGYLYPCRKTFQHRGPCGETDR